MNSTVGSNLPKFKVQNMQRKRYIANQLEKDISGIVNRKKVFNRSDIENEVNENIATRLRAFLDERLSKRLDNLDTKNHSQHNNNQNYDDDDYYEDDEDYYNENEDNYYDDDYDDNNNYDSEKNNQSKNPNSYLPFAYEEFQPEAPNDEELEEMILNAIMPTIAQWLDLNIDRIVHKVVKESLQNRGMPEGEYSVSKRGSSRRKYNQNLVENHDDIVEDNFKPSPNFTRKRSSKRNAYDYEEEEIQAKPTNRTYPNQPLVRGASVSKPVATKNNRQMNRGGMRPVADSRINRNR
ncbi:MAG: hypothetical protein LBH40_03430 [Alphaproteobacteria bacterium]|jgi:hypothetical protein|nr:hypothetical protein [Alphaproteobacteria bacterium]